MKGDELGSHDYTKHLSSLKMCHSRTWEHPATGKYPAYCFPSQLTSQDLWSPGPHLEESSCRELPASRRNYLKHDTVPIAELEL